MEVTLDPRQPVLPTLGSLDPGLTVDADSRLVRPDVRQDSYTGECQCPDDCPRDHDNE